MYRGDLLSRSIAEQVFMAASLNARSKFSVVSNGDSSANRQESCSREFRLSLGSLVFIWLLMLVMLVMVFLFGFHAGKQQGFADAYEKQGEHSVRLPIVRPLASAAGKSPSEGLVAQTFVQKSPIEKNAKADLANGGQERGSEDAAIDFTTAQTLAAKTAANPAESAPGAAGSQASSLAGSRLNGQTAGAVSPVAAEVQGSTEKKIVGESEDKQAQKTEGLIPSETTVPPGWYVQVAATEIEEEAEDVLARLKKMRQNAQVERVIVQKKLYFRVLIGPFGNKQSAEKTKDETNKARVYHAESFLRRVL